MIKEILSIIWALLKELLRDLEYLVKRIIYVLISLFCSFLIASIVYVENLPMWLAMTIGVVVAIIFGYFYVIIYENIKSPFCKISIKAKIIDIWTLTRRVDLDIAAPYYTRRIVKLEYKYKNKVYKKEMSVGDCTLKGIGSSVNIMVCKWFPKISYISDEKYKVN